MQKFRTILAIVLSLAVLYVYSLWFAPKPAPGQPAPGQPVSGEPVPGEPAPEFSDSQTPTASPPVSLTTSSQAPGHPVTRQNGTYFISKLDNEFVSAELSSNGGAFISWILKQFHTGHSEESPLINLFYHEKFEEALGLTLGDSQLDSQPQDYVTTARGGLQWETQNLQVTKSFAPSDPANPYVVDMSVTLVNKGSSPLILSPRVWIERAQKVEEKKKGIFKFLNPTTDLITPVSFSNGKLKTYSDINKLKPKEEQIGPIYWTGLTDRYFLTALISRQTSDNVSINLGKLDNDKIYTSLSYGSVTLKPGERIEQRYSAYLGPKERDELMKLGVSLERCVDYGWFGFVAIPILWLMKFFHGIVGNWGVTIIVLTFVIKLLLHPVNKKAMDSMKAMQKLQPELQSLREKYKDNKEKLNTEMMMLFKRRQVNPMSGCLPMILQMPIYFALYRVLYNAIELYHAPFFWFYRDLSAPDPYMVSPIVLGILMALQQKLTPSASADPMQQKMMMFMPLMFISFMLFLPSGLVIYILVNTVMSVVQQYMVQHDLSGMGLFKKVFARL